MAASRHQICLGAFLLLCTVLLGGMWLTNITTVSHDNALIRIQQLAKHAVVKVSGGGSSTGDGVVAPAGKALKAALPDELTRISDASAIATPQSYNALVQAAAQAAMEEHRIRTDPNALARPDEGVNACKANGLCSLGQVKPWLGDVYPTSGLKASMAARSYKGELIVFGETRVNAFLQAYNEFARLGMAHIMWLTMSQKRCEEGMALMPGLLGCGWSSQVFNKKLQGKMQLDRIVYAGRAARLGLNVLLMDTDIVLFHDPYKYLHAPPLADYNILLQRDIDGWANCGVVYLKNASADGPAAYLLLDVIDRNIRFVESGPLMQAKAQGRWGYSPVPEGCWDQATYSDTMLSVRSGRPIFYHCFKPVGALEVEWAEEHARAFGMDPVKDKDIGQLKILDKNEYPYPEDLLPPFSNVGFTRSCCPILEGEIRIPNAKGEWPEALGGHAFLPRGAESTAFMARLKEDDPRVWPDVDDPTKEAEAASKKERFAFFPSWFASAYSISGYRGHWVPELAKPTLLKGRPPVVVAHFVTVPGGPSNKATVMMATGRYNWTIAHMASKGKGVFFASGPGNEVPRVVAFSPAINYLLWPDIEAYKAAVLSLTRIALLTNRTASYPPLPCNASWAIKPEQFRHGMLPLEFLPMRFIPYGNWSDLKCMWAGYLPLECLKHRPGIFQGGMLPIEMEHLLDLVPPAQRATVAPPKAATAGAKLAAGNTRGGRVLNVTLSAEQVRAMAGTSNAHVLYIDALVTVTGTLPAKVEGAMTLLETDGPGNGRCYKHIAFR